MVRIRKNANTLTTAERDRFVAAFAQLNNQGLGRFADFRNMHTNVSSPQAHGAPGFLPWHRAYLLDLERELQAIDPGVALPYWRFDQAAPNLFTARIPGRRPICWAPSGSATTNPLQFWRTDGVQGINRRPLFNTAIGAAGAAHRGADAGARQRSTASSGPWRAIPHGSAHTSFGGSISSIGTAAKDPLFFLLHCNVDRLWAKWQRQNGRFDPALAASYDGAANPIGHNLPDTMWPWNGRTGSPRPPTAPAVRWPRRPAQRAGTAAGVRSQLDFQGVVSAASRMGFDYDDVRVR